jgi:hypothetical protein
MQATARALLSLLLILGLATLTLQQCSLSSSNDRLQSGISSFIQGPPFYITPARPHASTFSQSARLSTFQVVASRWQHVSATLFSRFLPAGCSDWWIGLFSPRDGRTVLRLSAVRSAYRRRQQLVHYQGELPDQWQD